MTFLEALGPAAVPTLICLGIGLLLLIVEMFTPGFGVAGIAGMILLGVAITLQYVYGDTRVATYILAIVLLVIVLALLWFIRSFQRGKLSRSFLVLNERIDAASTPDVAQARADYIGKQGVAVTPLRPAGIADIEGARVDVMSAGAFIEKDERITVVNAEGMHILVRPAEDPAGAEEDGPAPEEPQAT